MDKLIFRREDDKYSALYMNGYKDANWKRLARIGIKIAKTLGKDASLIDFGFGLGSAMGFFEASGIIHIRVWK